MIIHYTLVFILKFVVYFNIYMQIVILSAIMELVAHLQDCGVYVYNQIDLGAV